MSRRERSSPGNNPVESAQTFKRRRYVPVVLSRAEVEAVLSELEPRYRLVALLLYGCGLRLSECLGLRMQCFNLDAIAALWHGELVLAIEQGVKLKRPLHLRLREQHEFRISIVACFLL